MPHLHFRATLLPVTLAACLLATGCGGSDADDAEATVRDAFGALAKGDGSTFCNLLTDEQQKIAVSGIADGDAADKSCAVVLSEAYKTPDPETKDTFENPEVSVTVQGSTATAKVKNANTLTLTKIDGKWLISDGVQS